MEDMFPVYLCVQFCFLTKLTTAVMLFLYWLLSSMNNGMGSVGFPWDKMTFKLYCRVWWLDGNKDNHLIVNLMCSCLKINVKASTFSFKHSLKPRNLEVPCKNTFLFHPVFQTSKSYIFTLCVILYSSKKRCCVICYLRYMCAIVCENVANQRGTNSKLNCKALLMLQKVEALVNTELVKKKRATG